MIDLVKVLHEFAEDLRNERCSHTDAVNFILSLDEDVTASAAIPTELANLKAAICADQGLTWLVKVPAVRAVASEGPPEIWLDVTEPVKVALRP